MSKINVADFLEVGDIKAMAARIDVELEAVEAGDTERTKEVLRNLGDVEDALYMLASSIRKYVHLQLHPELKGPPSKKEAHIRVAPWEEKRPLLEKAIDILFKEDANFKESEAAVHEVVDNVDIENDLPPILDEMGIQYEIDKTWAKGFVKFKIGSKELTWMENPPAKTLNKQWHKILAVIKAHLHE